MRSDDIELLDRHLPIAELGASHADRLAEMSSSEIGYWAAWRGGLPVGHVMIRWSGFRFDDLPTKFPGVPLVMRLKVWPPAYWGEGIGSALMEVAERAAEERGYLRIGLGVEIDNERAVRLYKRLGYLDWGGGPLSERVMRVDEEGNESPHDEIFTVMTKRLGPSGVRESPGGGERPDRTG